MKKTIVLLAALSAVLLTGCGSSSPVGLLNVSRLTANWPQFTNTQNQLLADEQAIANGGGSNAQKQRQAAALQAKYAALSKQLVDQVKSAAAKVAQQKNLKLVVTNDVTFYGGIDITPDVEKVMGITESSPAPSSSP